MKKILLGLFALMGVCNVFGMSKDAALKQARKILDSCPVSKIESSEQVVFGCYPSSRDIESIELHEYKKGDFKELIILPSGKKSAPYKYGKGETGVESLMEEMKSRVVETPVPALIRQGRDRIEVESLMEEMKSRVVKTPLSAPKKKKRVTWADKKEIFKYTPEKEAIARRREAKKLEQRAEKKIREERAKQAISNAKHKRDIIDIASDLHISRRLPTVYSEDQEVNKGRYVNADIYRSYGWKGHFSSEQIDAISLYVDAETDEFIQVRIYEKGKNEPLVYTRWAEYEYPMKNQINRLKENMKKATVVPGEGSGKKVVGLDFFQKAFEEKPKKKELPKVEEKRRRPVRRSSSASRRIASKKKGATRKVAVLGGRRRSVSVIRERAPKKKEKVVVRGRRRGSIADTGIKEAPKVEEKKIKVTRRRSASVAKERPRSKRPVKKSTRPKIRRVERFKKAAAKRKPKKEEPLWARKFK